MIPVLRNPDTITGPSLKRGFSIKCSPPLTCALFFLIALANQKLIEIYFHGYTAGSAAFSIRDWAIGR